jgi:hypothetical protein
MKFSDLKRMNTILLVIYKFISLEQQIWLQGHHRMAHSLSQYWNFATMNSLGAVEAVVVVAVAGLCYN